MSTVSYETTINSIMLPFNVESSFAQLMGGNTDDLRITGVSEEVGVEVTGVETVCHEIDAPFGPAAEGNWRERIAQGPDDFPFTAQLNIDHAKILVTSDNPALTHFVLSRFD